MRTALLAVLACLTMPAFAQFTPPLGARHAVGGPRTLMLTMANTHLSAFTGKWSKGWLEPVVDKLAAWKPTLITVEQLSGAQCEMMRTNPAVYGEVFEDYCRDASPFQRSLRLTQPQAAAETEQRLAQWGTSPTPTQRRDLAMLFLAAGDPYSAMVQWLRLPESERRAADTLTDDAAKLLSRPTGRLNETYDIAAAVAARVGLERLYAVDDHTSDATDLSRDAGFGPWQLRHFDAFRASGQARRNDEADSSVRDAASFLAYYRAMNGSNAMASQIDADFGGSVADPDPNRYGRRYVAWWETRNLRMAANVREATLLHPGARVLNIVGASHKPWYDQWARQMADTDVVDAAAVLGH